MQAEEISWRIDKPKGYTCWYLWKEGVCIKVSPFLSEIIKKYNENKTEIDIDVTDKDLTALEVQKF